MNKSILVLVSLLALHARAEIFVNFGLKKPKIESVVCIYPHNKADVYLLDKDSVFNKDQIRHPQWPEIKGLAGEYNLENSSVAHFTPGKSKYSMLGNKLQLTVSLLNENQITKRNFVSLHPWDGDTKNYRQIVFLNDEKKTCYGQ